MTKQKPHRTRGEVRAKPDAKLPFAAAGRSDDDLLAIEMLLEDLLRLLVTAGQPKAGAICPASAPELWQARDRKRRETPPDFIRRVYGPCLGQGLTRAHLLALDPKLSHELSLWLRRHPGDEIARLLSQPTPSICRRRPSRPV